MKSVVVKVRQENTVAVRDKLEKEHDKERAGRSHNSTNVSRYNSSRITKRSRSKGRGSKTPSSSRGKDDKTGTSRKRHRSTSLDNKLSDKVRNKDAATEAPSDANASAQEVIDLTEDGSTASTSAKLEQKSSNHEENINVNQTEQPLEKTKAKSKKTVRKHNRPHKGDTKLQRILNPPFTWVLCAVRDFRIVNYTAELMQVNRAPEHKELILKNRAHFTKKAYKKPYLHLQDGTKTIPDAVEKGKIPPTTERHKDKQNSVPTAKVISVIPPLKKASVTQTDWTIPSDAKFNLEDHEPKTDLEDHEPKPDLATTPDQQDQGSQDETSATNYDEVETSEETPIQGCPKCASYDPLNCIQDIPETDEGILTTDGEDSAPEETQQTNDSSDGEYVSEDDQVWQRDARGHQ